MPVEFIPSIHAVDAAEWDALWPHQYPFLKHGFLSALEDSGSLGGASGWQPLYAVMTDPSLAAQTNHTPPLAAALPLFIKSHSYGEYVFDWSWANAYHQSGLDYYPKLIAAAPFTPSTGPRFGFANQLSPAQHTTYTHQLIEAAKHYANQQRMSGLHILFPCGDHNAALSQHAVRREGYQFHWFNRNQINQAQAYRDFDDFLSHFSSRKRKNIKKERQKVGDYDLHIRVKEGKDVSLAEWQTFYSLYQDTYLKRSGHTGYLGADFFPLLGERLADNLVLIGAYQNQQLHAASLFFKDEHTLYGRYWGCHQQYDHLHFETCYYQGIDYAIQQGLQRFDPGAQGEHKIQRGFTPIKTASFHWLAHPQFNAAIANFVQEEAAHVDAYIADARTYLPFKEGETIIHKNCLIEPLA